MTKSLRSWHFRIWTLLALLFPLSLFVAWWAIPEIPYVVLPDREQITALPLLLQSQETPQHIVNIRANPEKTVLQVEWKNKTALLVPTAIIYRQLKGVKDITNNEIIGRIEARGEYRFPVSRDSSESRELHLVVYDFIHNVVIERLIFKI